MHMFDLEQWIVGVILIFLLVADGARIVRLIIFELVVLPVRHNRKTRPSNPPEVTKTHVVVELAQKKKAFDRKMQNPRRGPP